VVSSTGTTPDGVECPTCGRDDFASKRGMKIHHSQAHDESLAHYEYCENCGEEFPARPSKDRRFCSQDCLVEHRDYTGKRNPHFKSVETECAFCGATLLRRRRRVEAFQWQFCDKNCHAKFREGITGEDHPLWEGGEINYGPNWEEQRRKARRRDQCRCQDCGMTDPEHLEEFDCRLSVHHITPVRDFIEDGDLDYEAAHQLENLVTVCRSCHQRRERLSEA